MAARAQEPLLSEVQFSTPTKALGLGDTCVWATGDAGQQWERRYCQEAPAANLEPLHHLTLSGRAEVLVLAGEKLLQSHDEGRSWEPHEFTGVALRDVSVSREGIRWLAGDKLLDEAPGTRGVLFQSRDGGRTWVEQELGVSSEEPWHLRAVWPVSEAEIWAVGDFILRSTDSGRTWSTIPVSPDMLLSRRLSSVQFIGGKTGWIEQVPAEGQLWVTQDGGVSFQALSLPGISAQGVIYTSDQEAWVVSGRGVHHSTDAGRTWTVSLEGEDLERGRALYTQLVFLPEHQLLVALGEGRIARCLLAD